MTSFCDRRQFFEPRRLGQEMGGLREGKDGLQMSLEQLAAEPTVTLRREAMACMFEIQLGALDPGRSPATGAFETIDQLEMQMSVYRPDSDVSRINASAHLGPVTVGARLLALVARCQGLCRRTKGAFDISAGPLIRTWGFHRRQGRLPSPEEIDDARRRVGADTFEVDRGRSTIRFTRPGVELNLGAIGKGYTLDRVVADFRAGGLGGALLSAGHSSIFALGRPPWDEAWQIDIAHPQDPRRVLAAVRLRDRGFSTSGMSEQFFEHAGRRYGHLIDPRTGWPAQGMLQASVAAPDAALAEALSTAFYVQGVQWAEDYCRRNPRIGAILVPDPGPGERPRVHVIGSIDARVAGVVH